MRSVVKWALAAALICVVAVLVFFSMAPGVGQGWELEERVRIYDGVSCCVVRLGDGRYRMYFTRMGGIFSAVSGDGLEWTVEEGVRVESPAANPAIIELGDGRYRMIYDVRFGEPPKEGRSSGMSVYFVSAISEDGLDWEEEGVCFRSQGPPDYDAISVPDIVELPDGRYRMYYTGDMFGPLEEREGNRVRSAITSDKGRSWTREEGDRLEFESMDPEVVKLPDGRYRMYYTANPDPQRKGEQWIYSAISSDGLSFQKEEVVLRPRRGMRYLDPEVVEIEGGYRMYISEASGQPPDETINIVSAYLAR